MGINSTQNPSSSESDPNKEKLAEKPSANLSYLVNSLKKFVNTSSASGGAPSGSNTTPMATSSDFANQLFDPSSSFQNSFISEQRTSSTQRPGTPTKDEIYQPAAASGAPPPPPPPLPPTSPQFIHQAQPPPPPPPSAPMQFHPMYQMQHPPPHHMGLMNMQPNMPPLPSSDPSQLMVDPNFHPNFMYNQPPPQLSPVPTGGAVQYQYPNQQSKMLISPGSNSSVSPNPNMKSGQVNSPNNTNSGNYSRFYTDLLISFARTLLKVILSFMSYML